MSKSTTTRLYGHRAFIVISRNGETWHHGWSWAVYAATRLGRWPLASANSALDYSVGPCLHRGTAPFRVLATMAARNHADRIQF